MENKFAPYKRESDHTFIHEVTPKMQKLKQENPQIKEELEEVLTLIEDYIQANLQRKITKPTDGMKGFKL